MLQGVQEAWELRRVQATVPEVDQEEGEAEATVAVAGEEGGQEEAVDLLLHLCGCESEGGGGRGERERGGEGRQGRE